MNLSKALLPDLDGPVRIPFLVCNDCSSVEFPGCSSHQVLLNRTEPDGSAYCAILNCDTNMSSALGICKRCHNVRKQLRFYYMRQEDVTFALKTIGNETQVLSPLGLVCPACKAFELPGNATLQ